MLCTGFNYNTKPIIPSARKTCHIDPSATEHHQPINYQGRIRRLSSTNLCLPELVDERGAPVRILAAVERVQLGGDHVESIVREEELSKE